MRTTSLAALLCLCAFAVHGYDKTSFQAFIEVGYPKILLSKENSAEKSECLWYSGPRLDGKSQEFSFVFVPENDGTVFLRFGPGGRDDIPCYYSDIRVNGVPVDNSSGWSFTTSPGGKVGALVSGTILKLYYGSGVFRILPVRKGVRTEVTMQGKSGSVLEAYVDQLSAVTASLDEAAKASPGLQGGALASGRELAQCLNELTALSEKHLRVFVPSLSLDVLGLAPLQAHTLELAKAYEAQVARTADDEHPCLYDQPDVRAEIKGKITQAARLAAKLKAACLLAFMLGPP